MFWTIAMIFAMFWNVLYVSIYVGVSSMYWFVYFLHCSRVISSVQFSCRKFWKIPSHPSTSIVIRTVKSNSIHRLIKYKDFARIEWMANHNMVDSIELRYLPWDDLLASNKNSISKWYHWISSRCSIKHWLHLNIDVSLRATLFHGNTLNALTFQHDPDDSLI